MTALGLPRRTPVQQRSARPKPEPVPTGFGVRRDGGVRVLRPDIWFGGSPARVLRLTPAGQVAWDSLRSHGVRDPAGARLARRLTDAGLAHPVPPATERLDVTVLIPVLDRPAALDRCLAAVGRDHPVVVVDDGSRDPAAIARVTAEHGARLVRRPVNGGPAAARNSGLDVIGTEFVAFVDSDCIPPSGWLDRIAGHLADPLVAAVAPRVLSATITSGTDVSGTDVSGTDASGTDASSTAGHDPVTGWMQRYARARGGLDLGSSSGRVAPKARVSYVPTAALLARVSALRAVARAGYVFDPALRFGEDVDLVWRLHEADWRVRYDPSVQVEHHDPQRWGQLLHRRFRYGTSAAPLGRAHPDSIAPLVLHPWAGAAVAALLAGRPLLAAGAYAMSVREMTATLRAADVPTTGTARAMAGAVGQTWLGLGRFGTQFAPALLAAGALLPGGRTRRLAAASLLLGPALHAWAPHRRDLNPAQFVLAHLADEVAYGLGVWTGCRRTRTLIPVRPALSRRRPARRDPAGRT